MIDSGHSKLIIGNYVFTSKYFAYNRRHNFHGFTVSLADLYALLINALEKAHLLRCESMIPATPKMEFYVKLVSSKKLLTNVTIRSSIDVAGVQDTPMKLVIIKSLKMNERRNFKIMIATKKSTKATFRDKGNFLVIIFWSQFSGWKLSVEFFLGGIFQDTVFYILSGKNSKK